MAEVSKIEWTDSTFNPWVGCQKVSPGCDHCYAEAWSKRTGQVEWGPHGERRRTSVANWKKPRDWQRDADWFERTADHKHRVFCASLADVFDNRVPEHWRADLFALIRATPRLDWLLLTKRPQNMRQFLPADWGTGYPNVWLGTTAEDQKHFNMRWRPLASTPATVRFISYEPAVGSIELGDAHPDWIITGGESGPGARHCEAAWFRSMRDQCSAQNIAFFHKQWGTWQSNPLACEGGMSRAEVLLHDPHGKGGGLLDGRLWREFPAAADTQAIPPPAQHQLDLLAPAEYTEQTPGFSPSPRA